MKRIRSIRNRALAAILATAAGAAPATAQQAPAGRDTLDIVHVPPIVVTATRTETPAERVASDVTVITREEIERRRYATALDALRDAPGLAVAQAGAFGGVASVFLRGAPSEHTLVLVDGVEVNDPAAPAGAYDFAHLAIENVERIEILKGPQSPLYGSAAMGGVVHVFTRTPGGSPRGSLTVEGGAFETWRLAASTAGGAGSVRYAATVAHRSTDGISASAERLGNPEDDGDRSTTLSGTFGWSASESVDLTLAIRGRRSETDLDQEGPAGDDPNFDTGEDEASARVEAEYAAGRWEHRLALDFARHDRETLDRPDPARPQTRLSSEFEGRRWTAEWMAEALVGPGVLATGLEWDEERAETALVGSGPFGDFESGLPEATARTAGGFLQHQASFDDRLFVTAGGRVDHHDEFGAVATWRVAPAFLVRSTGTRIRATAGTGFKAPTLFQLFAPQFGNPDLEAEESLGWDAGVEQDLAAGRVRLSTTVFGTEFEDLVAFDVEGFRNVRSASARGLETVLSAWPTDRVRVTASYTFTDTEDEEEDEPLLRRPRHAADLHVATRLVGGGDASLGARWIGERDDLDFSTFPAERVALDSYLLVRATASWPVSSALRVFGRVENLLDETYEEVLHFGTPGRSAYLGLKADL
ncbi:MAG: TonB-dependent receptor [Gemmatimonadetes bacterium]|nr:TonB-dependent receptor [Gemmatimonadota bacterium]